MNIILKDGCFEYYEDPIKIAEKYKMSKRILSELTHKQIVHAVEKENGIFVVDDEERDQFFMFDLVSYYPKSGTLTLSWNGSAS